MPPTHISDFEFRIFHSLSWSLESTCRSASAEKRATVRATGDDFGSSPYEATSAPEPNIVSGGTLRRRDGRSSP
jgi:hypothetical protein